MYLWHRGYPQIHVLPGRYLFSHAANFFTGPSNPLPNVGTVLLDFGFCEGAPTLETERWIGTGQSVHQPMEFRGSTVLIVDDRQEQPGQASCVVYAIGGDESPGHGGCPCQDDISNQVLRMVDPSPTATWEDDVPQLQRSRTYANAVLMLDGSIIVFGGLRKVMDGSGNWTGNCDYVFRPERLEPDEVFETPLTEWTLLCKGFRCHAHHSVAGALPNGQAFLAGGDDSPDLVDDGPDDGTDPDPCHVPAPTNLGIHVVELFSPPYMFQGPAPEIVAVSNAAPLQGVNIFVDVEIPGPLSGEYKVALLAPSTMTHSVNFSQRYVMLRVTGQVEVSPEMWQLDVRIPSLPEAVPPGYYMLTVVSATGVPSAASWIKVWAP